MITNVTIYFINCDNQSRVSHDHVHHHTVSASILRIPHVEESRLKCILYMCNYVLYTIPNNDS